MNTEAADQRGWGMAQTPFALTCRFNLTRISFLPRIRAALTKIGLRQFLWP